MKGSKQFRKRVGKKVTFISIIAIILTFFSVVVYGYFLTAIKLYTGTGETKYFRVGMELNTFFDIIDNNTISNGTNLKIKCTDTSVATQYTSGTMAANTLYYTTVGEVNYYVYNSGAEWGSPSNPYIISATNHIQNLFVLQNCGYFYNDIQTGISVGGAHEDDIPYFLVCKNDGKPTTINGTGKIYESIGNDAYPFIGYMGGAFSNGTSDNPTTTQVDSKSSDQSVIYNFVITTDYDVIDVGLFGRMGYIGDDTTAVDGIFNGVASTVRDLLLYDIQIKVKAKSTWESIADFIAEHIFTFSKSGDYANSMAHEDHHVGILAGHVDYTTVEYISVYYSSDDICAIDVDHTEKTNSTVANYYSVSGIMGYVNGMNSTQENGTINIGGISNSDIEMSSTGAGSGGGIESGNGRGYVTAVEVYKNYSDNGKFKRVTYQVAGETRYKYGILVEYHTTPVNYVDENGNTNKTLLTLEDGTPVSVEKDYTLKTYAASKNFFGNTEVVTETWTDFIVHDTSLSVKGTGAEYFFYTSKNESSRVNVYASQVTQTGVSLKYAAQLDTTTNKFSRLCIQYERDRIGSSVTGWSQMTNRYYFYDGVFTFALADATDGIEETWKLDDVGKIVVGQDDDDLWTQDTSGLPNSVVAFMKPITQESELYSGKEIFIAYKDGDTYKIVTLAANSEYNPNNGDDSLTTALTSLELVDSDTYDIIESSLNNNMLTIDKTSYSTIGELKSAWGSIQVLDLGSTTTGLTLEQLRKYYTVKVTSELENPTSGTTEDDGTTTITQALMDNSKTVKNTYYTIDSVTGNTSSDDLNNALGKTYNYFTLKTNPTSVSLSNVLSKMNTYNSTYYEDDWTTAITGNSNSPLNTRLSMGSAITQSENHTWDGFIAFETTSLSGSWLYYNCKLNFFYVTASGKGNVLLTSDKVMKYSGASYNGHTEPYAVSGVSTKTPQYGVNVYSFKGTDGNTYTGPILYLEGGNYYSSWDYSRSVKQVVTGSNQVTLSSGKYVTNYTATYNYIVATQKGSGVVYTLNGLNDEVTNFSSTTNKISSINGHYLYDTSYSIHKDYNLYSCKKGSTAYSQCILITRYEFDGVYLKSLTASGVSYSLINTSNVSVSTTAQSTTATNRTLTVDGITLTIYKTSGNKLVVCLANFALDGYFTANITDTSTTYMLNGSIATQEPMLLPITVPISNGSKTKYYNLYLANQTAQAGSTSYLGIKLIHTETGAKRIYEFWHETSGYELKPTDDPDPYKLRILRRGLTWSSQYSMMVSTDANVDGSNASVLESYNVNALNTCNTLHNSTKCTVILNGDGTAYLQYTVEGTTRYLSYSTNGYFTSGRQQNASSKLYLFTVEATHNATSGNTYVPIAGTQVGNAYAADEYVLWPENTYKSTDPVAEGETNPYNPSNSYMQDTSYSIKSLDQLATMGWRNKNAQGLSSTDLEKTFVFSEGISEVNMINLWGGNTGTLLGSDGYVKAPVGTTGEESYIPTGCVAFRVNKAANTNKIRVIIAVPISEYYYGQTIAGTTYNPSATTGLDYSKDYSFCMWKVDEANATQNYSFSSSNSYEAFELPRSTPYNPNDTDNQYYSNISGNSLSVTGTDNVKKYIDITMNGNPYRAYLNGEEVLVAYEFTAAEVGIYLLGSTTECRIVFFSADASADPGKDGMVSYKMGTVDFVYDNGSNKVITTLDSDPVIDGNYDYTTYYYPTLSLLYFDNSSKVTSVVDGDTDYTVQGNNKYPNINDFKIYVRRVLNSSAAQLQWEAQGGNTYSNKVVDASYIIFSPYSLDADNIIRRDDKNYNSN